MASSFQIAFGNSGEAENPKSGKSAVTPASGQGFGTKGVSFEDLLRGNPKDRRIYDAYAQTLIREKKFDRAIEIYRRALLIEDQLQNNRQPSLLEAIEEAYTKKKFFEAMNKEPGWKQARKTSLKRGELVTNIPQAYSEPLVLDLAVLIAEEKAMLEKILGPPRKKEPFFRINVAGRDEEYRVLRREAKSFREDFASGFGSSVKNEAIVLFTGENARWTLAHELAFCFLRAFYIEQPSGFLDEGLAGYLAFKLAKAEAKPFVEETLRKLKDLRDQGRLKRALDVFPSWERYDKSPGKNKREDLFLRAWSLTAFFLDGENIFFSKFFHDYLQYELQRGPLSRKDAENYFHVNLSEERIRELDREWGLFIERMDYDHV